MDDCYLKRSRNEALARKELSTQAQTLLVLRPLESILGGHLRRGYADEVEVDMMSAVMWLFDAMMYLESRPDLPGITRIEAQQLLCAHFSEAYPGWPTARYEQLSVSLFQAVTPNEPFTYHYYDFVERQLKEGVFRYIYWSNSPCGKTRVFNLTEQGVVFYTTRLDESSLDRADILAKKAQRTLRRGEITMAIEYVQSTKNQMDNFMTRIRVGLRTVRSGDIHYSFASDMKPLIEDAYLTLKDITERLQDTLKEIGQMREHADTDPQLKERLREAERTFHEVMLYSRGFRNEMGTVHNDYLKYRVNIAAKREQATFAMTLTEALLKPLLTLPIDTLQQHLDTSIQYALPPHTHNTVDERFRHFDLKTLLTYYEELFEQEADTDELDDSSEIEYLAEQSDSLPREAVMFAHDWVARYLETEQRISFQDVLSAFDNRKLTKDQKVACLIVIGGMATSDDPTYQVSLGETLAHALWTGDNVTVYRASLIDTELKIDALTKADGL